MSLNKNINIQYNVLLAGNPNVGKSTLFNALTGAKQHTGNWAGKTVETAAGEFFFQDCRFIITDLPGLYSTKGGSPDEAAAADALSGSGSDCVIITADASAPRRCLGLALNILEITDKAVLCLNLTDEAEKKNIRTDTDKLSSILGIPVVSTSARSGKGLEELKTAVLSVCSGTFQTMPVSAALTADDLSISGSSDEYYAKRCDDICRQCVSSTDNSYSKRDRRLDRILTSKKYGIPVMVLLLALIFYLTISGANYPSELLSECFSSLGCLIRSILDSTGADAALTSLLTDGIFGTLASVISVMLPPMLIFFPLFSLLEDLGYLPRVSFMLDPVFSKAGTDGKQALTMMQGFGCNACGVTGCRIIGDRNKRNIAAVTNCFSPCNGRFPMMIAVISMFLTGSVTDGMKGIAGAGILTAAVVFGAAVSMAVTKLLSKTIYPTDGSGFILELPPYRRPQILRTIIRSIKDKTLAILGRAAIVAAPAGCIIWLLANIRVGDSTLIGQVRNILEPIGQIMGLDGAILAGFLLGAPANEIVIPIIMMIYLGSGSAGDSLTLCRMQDILAANGWTIRTAVCTLIFTMMHFPCAATCLTIYKETKSAKSTLLAVIIPTLCGALCCTAANLIMIFLGL